MKILILGAGQVGSSVTESLASEQNDITVVDLDGERLKALTDRLDVRAVVGNAAHPAILRQAGAEDTEMLIAVTQSDETNLVACRMAASLFNIPSRIARIRATDYLSDPQILGKEGFDVEHSICPEQVLTDYIVKLIEFPEALQVLEFAGGSVSLVAVRAFQGGPLVGHPIADLKRHVPRVDSRIAAIFRGDRAIIPDGDTVVQAGDEVFCMAASEHIRQVMQELRRMDKPVRRLMIAGGGNIGLRLARSLEDDYQVKLIEFSKRRCEFLAEHLHRTLILHGDITDEELLEAEHVSEMDMFVAVTNDDENNIMASLLAKRMGVRRVVALINRRAYADLVQSGPIDVAISPAQATIGTLLAHVRHGDCAVVHSLRRGAAEALELIAHGDAKSSKVIGRRVEEVKLPKGATVGALIRNVADADGGVQTQVLMAHHDTVIEPEDHVIVFVTNKRQVPQVERLFQVGIGFL